MTENSGALRVALAYYQAWTHHDFELAMSYVAEDIVCQAPAGRLEGSQAFRDFMEPFSRLTTRSELLAAFGDEDVAVLMYDTNTVAVAGAPGAERLCVIDGRIGHLRIIFDRLPFVAAREAAAAGAGAS